VPDTSQLLVFIAAGWLLNLTPGPDVLYIISTALRHGVRAGIVGALGILSGCFVHVLAAAVGVDLLGLAAGSNLQVRLYSYVVLWAAPQFVLFVVRVSRRVTVPGGPAVRGAALLAVFAVLLSSSVLKSTLDPVLSNRWLGYHPSEVQAVRTWTQHSQSSSIWVGIDARVVFAYVAESGVTVPRFNSLSAIPAERVGSGFALQSPLTLSNNRVWNLPLPELLLGDRIYDNGTSQILWRHPLTQFQR